LLFYFRKTAIVNTPMAATAFGIYCFKVTNKEEKEQALTIGIYSSKNDRICSCCRLFIVFSFKRRNNL
jgi:hypothetical protein